MNYFLVHALTKAGDFVYYCTMCKTIYAVDGSCAPCKETYLNGLKYYINTCKN